MSEIGALVAELIDAGCAPEVAARVVAQAYVAGVSSTNFRGNSTGIPVDEVAEKRRAYDRERKRKSTGNPPDSTGIPRNSTNATLSKEESKKEENKEERGATQRNVRGQRLPDDWRPTPPDRVTAEALIGQQRVDGELEKFRDHWKQQPGGKGVKLDWNAAWRNWIRRAAEYRGGTNGHGTHNSHTNESRSTAILAGVAAAAERRFGGSGQGAVAAAPENSSADDPDFIGASASAPPH